MGQPTDPAAPVRLNLGSGQNPLPGYINVDRSGNPDLKWDLEQFPWPWADNSVDEIRLHHVLEHLGEQLQTFFGIIKELYRVCKPNALVTITVPHPRHDDFLGDPTHVRAFGIESFRLYSKAINREFARQQVSCTPLGLYLDVDFALQRVNLSLEEPWKTQFHSGQIAQAQLEQAAKQYNNVICEITVEWRAVKG